MAAHTWTPDGDCMILEFLLPVASKGEIAPAVKGTIKVFRKGNVYKFTWDLLDDAESPNKITGTWQGQLKRVVNVE